MAVPSSNITNVRGKKAKDRLAKVAAGRPNNMVRVVPRDADMRRLLEHPKAGPFRGDGGADWPHDKYTTRRLAEGSIKLESETKEVKAEKTAAKPSHSPAA